MRSSAKAFIVYNKKVLLILRDNLPSISDPNKWSIPGGEVEEGETYEDALRRELFEELCISPSNILSLGKLHTANGIEHKLFLVPLIDSEVAGLKIGNEGQEFRFFSFAELKELDLAKNLKIYLTDNFDILRSVIEEDTVIVPEQLGLF